MDNNFDLYKSLFRSNFTILSSTIQKINILEKEIQIETEINTKILSKKDKLIEVDKDLYNYLIQKNNSNIQNLNNDLARFKTELDDIVANINQDNIDSDFIRFYNDKRPASSINIIQIVNEWSKLYNYNLRISPNLLKVLKNNVSKDMDTIVVACNKPENVESSFLKNKEWVSIKISDFKKEKLKYLALYEGSSKNAITYIDEIESILDCDKKEGYKKIKLKGFTKKIQEEVCLPLKLGERKKIAPKGSKYTSLELIKKAKSMDDIFID